MARISAGKVGETIGTGLENFVGNLLAAQERKRQKKLDDLKAKHYAEVIQMKQMVKQAQMQEINQREEAAENLNKIIEQAQPKPGVIGQYGIPSGSQSPVGFPQMQAKAAEAIGVLAPPEDRYKFARERAAELGLVPGIPVKPTAPVRGSEEYFKILRKEKEIGKEFKPGQEGNITEEQNARIRDANKRQSEELAPIKQQRTNLQTRKNDLLKLLSNATSDEDKNKYSEGLQRVNASLFDLDMNESAITEKYQGIRESVIPALRTGTKVAVAPTEGDALANHPGAHITVEEALADPEKRRLRRDYLLLKVKQ